jgi:hypothetical protein
MANNVTEGAIVQHLAKIRARRVQKDKEVPPPLRRGVGVGSTASPKPQETPATPVSPAPSAEESGARRAKPHNETKAKAEKRPASDEEYYTSSDSDKEWTSSQRPKPTTRSRQKKTHKKRKPTPPAHAPESVIDDKDDDDDGDDGAADGSIASDAEAEMVAVGAEFLEFVNDEQKEEYDTRSSSEDEDTDKALIVKLNVGAENLRLLKHKGIGVFQGRDPEQRWIMPPSDPNVEKWGFSKDYYGPVPKSCHNPHNPGLLRGEWPLEVAMRQYAAPQAVTWANETYVPDPRLVHPANYLEGPSCNPQLKFHRKLRGIEESDSGTRRGDQKLPAYQAYMNTHRELPTYFDQSWKAAPTINTTQSVGDFDMQDFATTSTTSPSIAAGPYHHDFNNFLVAQPQIEEEVDTQQTLDVKHTVTTDDQVQHGSEPSLGKTSDVDKKRYQNIVEDAKGLFWWQD